ncbi:MAG: spore coat protein CotH [Clostridiales bacterium]|nr:spore coat protein CotH [Clostridiales bacterium]
MYGKRGESVIQSKKINIIIAVALAFSLCFSISLVVVGNMKAENGNIRAEPEYASKIFGRDIITIEIIADEKDWQDMLDNAINEEYIMADVIVNGTRFQNVGVRPKGNSSLTQVASSDSDRYSFRLQFNEYIKGQTCFGLESFVVNNMIGDNTYMKEYISYELMQEVGVDAPYFGYADIKVNGEGWGLYLAVELYNDSYEQRVYGDTKGMLYNVKSMDMGANENMPGGMQNNRIGNMPANMPESMPENIQEQMQGNIQDNIPENMSGNMPRSAPGNIQDIWPDDMASNIPEDMKEDIPEDMQEDMQENMQENMQESKLENMPARNADRPNMPEWSDSSSRTMVANNRGRDGRGSSGGSLEYIDDNTDSYSAIFGNVVGKGTEKDYQRVVKAIKALSEGEDLESYLDVDQILRYLAAHTIVVNLDSYSSSMAQNYYIYERDGKITILPWDYNLAWGGFQSGNVSSVINFPIDTPVSGVEMSSRPLIEQLFSNKEYLDRYHSYLQLLIDTYFNMGKFEDKINTLDALISDYVKNDATAFCTYEEYKSAISSFITLGSLRAESVQGQLDGTIPSTTAEQNSNPDLLVASGDLILSDLGSMMGGRGGNNRDFLGRQEGQNRNTIPEGMLPGRYTDAMGQAATLPFDSEGEGSLISIGVLVILLIGAIIFAGKYKKNY